jgi:regulator of sigma E protease
MFILENVLWLLVLIGVMILIHELGHFMAARFFDVRVEVFSFGFGPRLFGFRKGETDYRFSAILFGGYVKMVGEQPGEETSDPRGFLAKPRWQRLVIAFAGPFMNILLAVGLLTGLFMVKYQKVAEPPQRGVIGYVLPGSAAAKAGIREGDRIVEIEGRQDPSWEDIVLREVASASKELKVVVERDGKRTPFWITPGYDERTGVGVAGWAQRAEVQIASLSPGLPAEKAGLKKGDKVISVNGEPIYSLLKFHDIIRASEGRPIEIAVERGGQRRAIAVQPIYASLDGPARWVIGVGPEQRLDVITTRLPLPDALRESLDQNAKSAMLIFQFLRGIVEQRMSPKSLEGPIRIAQLSGDAAREGPVAYIHLMAMVSLNLAIFNLLPIPILDGGVILLLLVEMLMRRDLSLSVKEAVFKLGFVFLMMVVVFVLYNDISKILPAG